MYFNLMTSGSQCGEFRPDHNGECLNCDERIEEHPEAMVETVRDYAAKVQFLVDDLDRRGLLEDGCYTFPDGDIWDASKRRGDGG